MTASNRSRAKWVSAKIHVTVHRTHCVELKCTDQYVHVLKGMVEIQLLIAHPWTYVRHHTLITKK